MCLPELTPKSTGSVRDDVVAVDGRSLDADFPSARIRDQDVIDRVSLSKAEDPSWWLLREESIACYDVVQLLAIAAHHRDPCPDRRPRAGQPNTDPMSVVAERVALEPNARIAPL